MNLRYFILFFFSTAIFLIAQVPPDDHGQNALTPIGSDTPAVTPSPIISRININFIMVGDPKNKAIKVPQGGGTRFVGNVDEIYKIAESKVTISQYCAFLNAVAATNDPYELYPTKMSEYIEKKEQEGGTFFYVPKNKGHEGPIKYVNWLGVARFCNWLHNGQLSGPEGPMTTERGAYNLDGATVFNNNLKNACCTVNADAKFFLPTENQWIKAVYYKGGSDHAGYWTKPQQQSVAVSDLSQIDQQTNQENELTRVGAYGIGDIQKTCYEWTDTPSFVGVPANRPIEYYQVCGGILGNALAISRTAYCDILEKEVGFRVAAPAFSEEN